MVVDMPKGTYEKSSLLALKNGKKIKKLTRCDALKLEGGSNIIKSHFQRILKGCSAEFNQFSKDVIGLELLSIVILKNVMNARKYFLPDLV